MGKRNHFPCPCGAELADECPGCARVNPLGSMRVEPPIGSRASYRLSDLYDADLRTRDSEAARLAVALKIPHPLHEVQYADGVLRDTTIGKIHSRWLRS